MNKQKCSTEFFFEFMKRLQCILRQLEARIIIKLFFFELSASWTCGFFFGGFIERCSDLGVVLNKTSVEAGEAKEHENIMDALRDWPVKDCVDSVVFHRHVLQINDKSKKVDCVSVKHALAQFAVELVISEMLEDQADVVSVFFLSVRIDENVIEIGNTACVKEITQSTVDV